MTMNGSGALQHLSSVPVRTLCHTSYKVPIYHIGCGSQPCPPQVRHCPDAWGLVLAAGRQHTINAPPLPPIALLYSGDTAPCPALVAAGRRCTTSPAQMTQAQRHTQTQAQAQAQMRGQQGPRQLPPGVALSNHTMHSPEHCHAESGESHRLLLIHEATFHDTTEGREHAARKRHSTVGVCLCLLSLPLLLLLPLTLSLTLS